MEIKIRYVLISCLATLFFYSCSENNKKSVDNSTINNINDKMETSLNVFDFEKNTILIYKKFTGENYLDSTYYSILNGMGVKIGDTLEFIKSGFDSTTSTQLFINHSNNRKINISSKAISFINFTEASNLSNNE